MKNEFYQTNDGWFTYYVNVKTGEKKFKLDPDDVEITAPKRDDLYRISR